MQSSLRQSAPTLATLVPRDVFGALLALGIDARERGDEATARCPHPDHDDRSASWSCNLDTGQHHCFSCNFGGSFVYLVGCMLGLTRGASESWVRDRKVKDVVQGIGPRERVVHEAAPVSEADMWSYIDPPAEALAERGLTLEACQEYGVRWDGDHQLWITPVREPQTGKLLGWQAKNQRIFRNYPKDLAKSKTLFGYGLVPDGGTVLLVESPLDCPYTRVACRDLGIYPVSSYGAAVSAEQVRLLRGRAGRVVLAMDNDRAGWKSVAQLAWSFGSVPVDIFDYGNTVDDAGRVLVTRADERDPGNLSMEHIRWGIEQAFPHWRLRIPWLS